MPRYRLRTLLIFLAAGPMVIAWAWFDWRERIRQQQFLNQQQALRDEEFRRSAMSFLSEKLGQRQKQGTRRDEWSSIRSIRPRIEMERINEFPPLLPD